MALGFTMDHKQTSTVALANMFFIIINKGIVLLYDIVDQMLEVALVDCFATGGQHSNFKFNNDLLSPYKEAKMKVLAIICLLTENL